MTFSAEHLEKVEKYRWGIESKSGYIYNNRGIYFQYLIIPRDRSDNFIVRHKNGDILDNRTDNLEQVRKYRRRRVLHLTIRKKWEDLETNRSEVKLCQCGTKFIEMPHEKALGYTREQCPFCLPYVLVRYAWKYLACKGKESVKQ